MLGGVAELVKMDPELLDDLKTAVSEACNNVVLHAYPGEPGPLTVVLSINARGIAVLVRDAGSGMRERESGGEGGHGIGVPVIQALSQRAEFRPAAGGGTEVWMEFAARRDSQLLFELPATAAPEDGWSSRLSGDAVVSVSPVSLLAGVLGRLSRAFAATARFSLDRFSDVYLVTDAIAAHASTAASGPRIGFSITATSRRLELTIGPFRPGGAEILQSDAGSLESPLRALSDELETRPAGEDELLEVVMVDRAQSAP
jgi:serine/threonine-protein kinase RsbW